MEGEMLFENIRNVPCQFHTPKASFCESFDPIIEQTPKKTHKKISMILEPQELNFDQGTTKSWFE
jgi:hypothetical protein